jgi:hypothetical protein
LYLMTLNRFTRDEINTLSIAKIYASFFSKT